METVTRYKHIIMAVSTDEAGNTMTDAKIFPSINHAKRYNRTQLGGKATVVTKMPKVQANHTTSNDRCDKV